MKRRKTAFQSICGVCAEKHQTDLANSTFPNSNLEDARALAKAFGGGNGKHNFRQAKRERAELRHKYGDEMPAGDMFDI